MRETKRCREIVRGLLDFARQTPPRRQATDLNDVARRAVAVVMNQLQLSHVALTLDLADDLPSVEADPNQMQQVLVNLLLNAADAIGERRRHDPARQPPHRAVAARPRAHPPGRLSERMRPARCEHARRRPGGDPRPARARRQGMGVLSRSRLRPLQSRGRALRSRRRRPRQLPALQGHAARSRRHLRALRRADLRRPRSRRRADPLVHAHRLPLRRLAGARAARSAAGGRGERRGRRTRHRARGSRQALRAVLHHQGRARHGPGPGRSPGASSRATAAPIEVESEQGVGTRFTVRLPLVRSAQHGAASVRRAGHRRRAGRARRRAPGARGERPARGDRGRRRLGPRPRGAAASAAWCSATSCCPIARASRCCDEIARRRPGVPVVLITGYATRRPRGARTGSGRRRLSGQAVRGRASSWTRVRRALAGGPDEGGGP